MLFIRGGGGRAKFFSKGGTKLMELEEKGGKIYLHGRTLIEYKISLYGSISAK